MKAITTCVNYDDYLSITLPRNKGFFDEFIVVTSSDDVATQQLCKENGVSVVITDRFYENEVPFNKGKAINEGLKCFAKDDWICHLDSDIILPDSFEQELVSIDLQTDTIYGCPRLMCPSVTAWRQYLDDKGFSKEWPRYKATFFIVNKVVKIRHFVPLGYFQLFHMSAPCLSVSPWYPEESPNAGESDVCFSLKWDKYRCIDSIEALHLPIVGPHAEGINWDQRRSPRLR